MGRSSAQRAPGEPRLSEPLALGAGKRPTQHTTHNIDSPPPPPPPPPPHHQHHSSEPRNLSEEEAELAAWLEGIRFRGAANFIRTYGYALIQRALDELVGEDAKTAWEVQQRLKAGGIRNPAGMLRWYVKQLAREVE